LLVDRDRDDQRSLRLGRFLGGRFDRLCLAAVNGRARAAVPPAAGREYPPSSSDQNRGVGLSCETRSFRPSSGGDLPKPVEEEIAEI
jgi:hypothetical protein